MGGFCRDCADFGPMCPRDGTPCDPNHAVFEVIGFDKDYGAVFSIELLPFSSQRKANEYCKAQSGAGITYTAKLRTPKRAGGSDGKR